MEEEFYFINLSFRESSKHIGAKTVVKVKAGKNASICTLVESAICEKRQSDTTCNVENKAVEAAIKCIKRISSSAVKSTVIDLLKVIDKPNATVKKLDSKNSPILDK
eukprot:722600-Ditylum_brightwellii.AAC.1